MKRRGLRNRKTDVRKALNSIVIICEGKVTEIKYLNCFKKRNSGVEIITLHKGYTDPINIAKEAKKQLTEFKLDLKNGDSIWCVFDVDHRRNDELAKAKKICGT